MIIDCISDLHGHLPKLSGGDLLIVAGDLTARDLPGQYLTFNRWLNDQDYTRKIVVAGNHDGLIEKAWKRDQSHPYVIGENAIYLQDSGTEFMGLKIWGSPWTPNFCNWHFMKERGNDIKQKWDLIPDDVDILITHGPALGIQDEVQPEGREARGEFAGCEELKTAIIERLKKLKLHVFGHIHYSYGKVIVSGVVHVNCSIMDEDYRPVNKPITIEL